MSATMKSFSPIRQLLLREKAFFKIKSQQASSVEENSVNSIKNLILSQRNIYLLHHSIVQQESMNKPVPFQDIQLLAQGETYTFPPIVNQSIQHFLNDFYSNHEKSAKAIKHFLNENPTFENDVIFSFIPALFSSFFASEEITDFISFLNKLDKYRESASRLLLFHPTLSVFLSFLDCSSIDSFIKSFEDRLFLFPNQMKQFFSDKDNFVNFFLVPILQNPHLYGMKCSSDSFLDVFSFEQAQINDMAQKLSASKKSIHTIPSYKSLTNVISYYSHMLYFLKSDLLIISKIGDIKLDFSDVDGLFRIPFSRRVIRSSSVYVSSSSTSLEEFLRQLVIQLDPSKSYPTINETLRSALTLHSSTSRLSLELQLDEFEYMKKDMPDDTEYYIRMLTDAYDQRKRSRSFSTSGPTFTDIFKVIQLHATHAITHLQKNRMKKMFLLWDKKNNSIDPASLIKSEKQYIQTYQELVASFINYCESVQFKIEKNQARMFVFEKLTSLVTPSKYRELKPNPLDETIYYLIENHREMLNAGDQQKCLEPFKKNPRLMELSKQYLLDAFKSEDAILMVGAIEKALTSINHVLSFQGYLEIGADFFIPLTLTLFIYTNPPNIASTCNYIDHVIFTLQEESPFPQNLIYNLTMVQSALNYFQSQLRVLIPE